MCDGYVPSVGGVGPEHGLEELLRRLALAEDGVADRGNGVEEKATVVLVVLLLVLKLYQQEATYAQHTQINDVKADVKPKANMNHMKTIYINPRCPTMQSV